MDQQERRTIRFMLLCNPGERQAIRDLAFHLRRSQGDAIRQLVMDTIAQIKEGIENLNYDGYQGGSND